MSILSLDALLDSVPVAGRQVFVRADLNVPLSDGQISDDSRIRASLPTLERLLAADAKIILASHLGRPKGKPEGSLSLECVAEPLKIALSRTRATNIHFVDDCIGESVSAAVDQLANAEILLLENLRFHAGETKNDPAFSKALARHAEIYVNDAFGTAHRVHASTVGMVAYPEHVAAGLLLQAELDALASTLNPERPFVCFLGGAKVSDKLGVLEALIERADIIGVGGAMAYTFLAALGEPVGRSLVESDRLEEARRILGRADQNGCRILLPTDHVVSTAPKASAGATITETIPEDQMGVDIGPRTADRFSEAATTAKLILWNGPMGIFEIDAFAKGTERLARAVAASAARTIVGGGDSLAAVHKIGVEKEIDHLSTGGGASLEFVQGLDLPGVSALDRPTGGPENGPDRVRP